DDLLDRAAGLAQDLAVLQADRPGQVLLAGPERIAEAADDLAPARRRDGPPLLEGLVRGPHRGRAVALRRRPHAGQDRAGGRVDGLELWAARLGREAAAEGHPGRG